MKVFIAHDIADNFDFILTSKAQETHRELSPIIMSCEMVEALWKYFISRTHNRDGL